MIVQYGKDNKAEDQFYAPLYWDGALPHVRSHPMPIISLVNRILHVHRATIIRR